MKPVVLIADDNDADIELVMMAFEECALDVTFALAHDGDEAIELLRGATPALLIVDIKMPRADGFAVLRAVRGDPRTRDIPVVMMSSSTAEVDRRRALEGGATRFWTKPSRFGDIVSLFATLPTIARLGTA